MNSKLYIFVLILTLISFTFQTTIYQAAWYHRKVYDTTTKLDTHYMGLRNFETLIESQNFIAADIKNLGTAAENLTENPIRTMILRDSTPLPVSGDNTVKQVDLSALPYRLPSCKNEFKLDRQFARHFLTFDLRVFSQRSFFLLEDLTDKLKDRVYARDCEIYFSVIYYKTKKDALAAFTAAVKDTTRKVALGGNLGIENCSEFDKYTAKDINHFLYKFTNLTCQVRFGMLGQKFNVNTKIMILPEGQSDSEILDHISGSGFVYLADLSSLPSCAIEDFNGSTLPYTFVPSEFFNHCSEHVWSSRTYNVCNNNPMPGGNNLGNAAVPFTDLYKKVGYCVHLNNKYLKIEQIDFNNYLPDFNSIMTELFDPTTVTTTNSSTVENEIDETVDLQSFIATPSNLQIKTYDCKCTFVCTKDPQLIQGFCDDGNGLFTVPCQVPGPDVRNCGTKCTPSCSLTATSNQGNSGYLRLTSSGPSLTNTVDTEIADTNVDSLNHSITKSYIVRATLNTPTGKSCCDDKCSNPQ